MSGNNRLHATQDAVFSEAPRKLRGQLIYELSAAV